jgi:hypothetical protein
MPEMRPTLLGKFLLQPERLRFAIYLLHLFFKVYIGQNTRPKTVWNEQKTVINNVHDVNAFKTLN